MQSIPSSVCSSWSPRWTYVRRSIKSVMVLVTLSTGSIPPDLSMSTHTPRKTPVSENTNPTWQNWGIETGFATVRVTESGDGEESMGNESCVAIRVESPPPLDRTGKAQRGRVKPPLPAAWTTLDGSGFCLPKKKKTQGICRLARVFPDYLSGGTRKPLLPTPDFSA